MVGLCDAYTVSSQKYVPFEQTASYLLKSKFLCKWASSGHAFVSFQFSPVVNCVQKHEHTKYMYYSVFAGHHQGFCCSNWEHSLRWFLSPLMMHIALKKHKSAIEFVYSTRSSRLPLWLYTPSIDCEEQRKWCTHRTNRIFEQTPSPHICLKVVCRKGRRIFVSLWYIHMQSLTDLTWYAGDNLPRHTHK